mmetsp:Transcript_11824/g.16752  ORF Transcript_11824/g.16752 Transcript_11824/m.16752 type:complete len:907 (+) Transcript_11824:103-2823(+)
MPGDNDKAARAAAQAKADADAKAKARARKPAIAPGRSLKQPDTGVSQPPMPHTSKGPRRAPAAAPGVVHVSTEEPKSTSATTKSTLEDDIAAKNRARPVKATAVPGAQAVGGQIEQNVNTKKSERDVLAKNRARPAKAAAVPGAQAVGASEASSPSKGGKNLDQDIIAKNKARRPGKAAAVPGAQAVGASEASSPSKGGKNLDQDIIAKNNARRPAKSSVVPGAETVSGKMTTSDPTALRVAEQDVMDKKQRRGAPAVTPGAVQAGAMGAATAKDISKSNKQMSDPAVMEKEDMPEEFDDYQRRLDEKIINQEQGIADRQEKMFGSASDSRKRLSDTSAERKISMERKSSLDSKKIGEDFDIMDSEPLLPATPNEVMLGADRGIANEPSYEYGVAEDDKGLAVAVAIEAEEEDLFLPAAIEYDPDSKPPIYKNRRFRLYACICILLFIAVIIAAAVGAATSGEKYAPRPPPTSAPTPSEDGRVIAIMKSLVGDQVLESGTYAFRAREWILYEDPLQLTDKDKNLDQRFLLAVFYFATSRNGEDTWLSCGRPVDPDDSGCTYLEYSLTEDKLNFQYIPKEGRLSWLSKEKECDWNGIECDDNDEVVKIDLFGQNMTGNVPSELAELNRLAWIGLAFNDFTGEIPSELAALRRLILIDLHYNMLSGEIPSEIWEIDNLQSLNVGGNSFLQGSIPTIIGELDSLKGLHLFDNNFTGVFPTEIGMLTHLAFSRNGYNAFSGEIPTEFGLLTQLQELWLQYNDFKGTIPTELGLLTEIVDFRIGHNAIKGNIPDELYKLTNLEFLQLEFTDVNGTLSTEVGNLLELSQLRLRGNQLSGQIPTELGELTKLELAHLHLNEFLGAIPTELCDNFIGSPYLQADCFGNPAPVPCDTSCCAICCERATRVCLTRD